MCLKKLCVTLSLSICSLNAVFAAEPPTPYDTVNVDRTAEKSGDAAFPRVIKSRPVDASGFRLAVLPDAVLIRWKFENPGDLASAVLEESNNGLPFTTVVTLSHDAGAYTAVAPGATSLYRIRMVSKAGTVVVSATVDADGSTISSAKVQ